MIGQRLFLRMNSRMQYRDSSVCLYLCATHLDAKQKKKDSKDNKPQCTSLAWPAADRGSAMCGGAVVAARRVNMNSAA